jgi:hypothetical protein
MAKALASMIGMPNRGQGFLDEDCLDEGFVG